MSFLSLGCFFRNLGLIAPAEHRTEQSPRNRARNKKLCRKRHQEVQAIVVDVVGNELIRDAKTFKHTQNAHECHLRYDSENLDGKDDHDGPVTGLHDTEGKEFGHTAGDKEGTQEAENVLTPHGFERDPERFVCEAAIVKDLVVKGHNVDHRPGSDCGENNGFKFCFRH